MIEVYGFKFNFAGMLHPSWMIMPKPPMHYVHYLNNLKVVFQPRPPPPTYDESQMFQRSPNCQERSVSEDLAISGNRRRYSQFQTCLLFKHIKIISVSPTVPTPCPALGQASPPDIGEAREHWLEHLSRISQTSTGDNGDII